MISLSIGVREHELNPETRKAAWKTDMLHLALMCQATGQLAAGQTAGLSP